MQRLFWFCFGQNGISPGQLSHCAMVWLQYKNIKGSYKSLQADRVRRHRAGWLWKKRGICCSKKKNWGSREVLAARKNEAKKCPGIGLLWKPWGWWMEKTPAAGGSRDRVRGTERARTWWKSSLSRARPSQHMWHWKYLFPPLKNGLSEGSQELALLPRLAPKQETGQEVWDLFSPAGMS